MVLVHGGAAHVGVAGDDDALPPATVEIPDYCIDKTEVTVARYRECVAAGRCARPETKVSASRRSWSNKRRALALV